jgi:hypothetical protein
MSVTAFPVLARILTDRNIHKSRLGVIALTCAAVDDATAWCLLAFVVGVVQAEPGRLRAPWQGFVRDALQAQRHLQPGQEVGPGHQDGQEQVQDDDVGDLEVISHGVRLEGAMRALGSNRGERQGVCQDRGRLRGGSNAGAVYSWGVAGTNALTERAFGSVSSGTPGTFAYGFLIQNTSGASLDISLAYTGEQWRNGGNVTAQKIAVSYKTVTGAAPTTAADWDPAGGILPTGYTAAPALDFTGPIATATLAALDGNAAANRQVFSNQAITTVAAGDYLIVRWADLNDAGNDHGLSLDDVTFTASPVHEPTSILAMCGFAGFVGNVIRRRRAAKKAAV